MRRIAALIVCVSSLVVACRRASATDRGAGTPTPSVSLSPSAAATQTPAAVPSTAAGVAASAPDADPAPASSAGFPYGPPTSVPRYTCNAILAGGAFRSFLSAADTRVAFVDGDDPLALVNRSPTGALPPSYAPADLVDARDGSPRKPAECESSRVCLRKEAAEGLRRMLDAMRGAGLRGVVQSAFRGFGTQCWVFAGWAHQARGGFCEASEQSALPGHSQHQLGTTVDLFTADWAERGAKLGQGVFRNGFGCSDGGKWLDDHSWEYGFVIPYPIDPDDRKDGSRCQTRRDHAVPIDPKTGYKHEPWHLRFVGVDAAARYHEAWLASHPGAPTEITLEQWLRAQRGLAGDTEIPVCDGCSCGACATLASEHDRSPCGTGSLRLDADGRVVAPSEEPGILEARQTSAPDGATIIEVLVHAPAHTPTQTPIASADGLAYGDGETFSSWAPLPDVPPHAYPDLPGAWRLAIEPDPSPPARWPWRVSLAQPDLAETWNRANLVLPAKAGDVRVRVRVPAPKGAPRWRVTLLRDGQEHGTRDVR